MSLLKPAKFFVTLSIALMLASAVLLVQPGPKLSLDFTGGTLMEISIPADKTSTDVQEAANSFVTEPELGNVSYSSTKSNSVLMRMRDLGNEEHIALLEHIESSVGAVEEKQFTTIGPTVGASLRERAAWALIVASVAIIVYIAFAFRRVPRKLSAWRFGIIAVVTLLHDVIITVGVFVILSHVTNFEFDTLFITALLTILGYSVNDTIVIFDRIRDNLSNQGRNEPFEVVAERSLQQSIARSMNTSISTLIMLAALFFLGSESVKWFVLALIVGAIIGTYSSIFLATPLLVYWRKKDR